MKAAAEIKSASSNIRYYVQKMREALDIQFDLDLENTTLLGNRLTEEHLFGEKIVEITGQIAVSCNVILLGCEHIERQVENAEKREE